MMATQSPTAIPVLVIGADAGRREWCVEQMHGQPRLRVLAAVPLREALSGPGWPPPDGSAPGVVVLVSLADEDLTAAIRGLRRIAPVFSILVVCPPPAPPMPGIAGWLAPDSPVDLGAAALVIATGGRAQDRVVAAPPAPVALADLTAREDQVVRLLARGLTNPDIARDLQIAPETVKSHVRHIIQKLHARDRTQAAVFAAQARIA